MNKLLAIVLALAIAVSCAACAKEQKETTPSEAAETKLATQPAVTEKTAEEQTGSLVIYAARDDASADAAVEMFRAAYPNIDVEVVCAGAEELCRRIEEESESPRADILWGMPADVMASMTDYLDSHTCADGTIGEAYRDADGLWTGVSPVPLVILYNKTLIEEWEVPATWEGLCDEDLKGQIAFADPAGSASAYTQLCTMLFSQDTIEEGWALVERFAANLDGVLQENDAACHELVASGVYALGITTEQAAAAYSENPDVDYVYPMANSAVPESAAVILGCPNPENAALFLDFLTGTECQTAQSADWGRRPVRSDVTPAGMCALEDLDLREYDYAYAAGNREEILEKWNERTGA